MRDYIRKRVVDISHYILESRATVRQAAAVFGVSKSTVHKDVTERLPRVSKDLARKVKRILDLNKAERHIRGGEATPPQVPPARPKAKWVIVPLLS
ncbi:MAG: sporulation transcriptional regulator SpoIIID, partial [Firmicutes bacterium]|nr:sporulation transcriptional regulator SpoIIID [Bacillota bacterium]